MIVPDQSLLLLCLITISLSYSQATMPEMEAFSQFATSNIY
jgi:hypothetical protein